MKVAVLGCGPAGLMAAQAVADAHRGVLTEDLHVTILSRKKKSPLYGAQYLHRPIPGATPPHTRWVSYQLRGSDDDYRRKVYGQMWSGAVSPEDLAMEHQAWDIRGTYDILWARWHRVIQDTNVDPVYLARLMADPPDLVINTIPRVQLCHIGHAFGAISVTAAGDAPALGIRVPFLCPDNTVICNGEDNPGWYRMSRVFDHTTVEWPQGVRVPVTTAASVTKPLHTDCDCWPEFLHVGRYGEWAKGVLSHTAYFKVLDRVTQLIGGRNATDEDRPALP